MWNSFVLSHVWYGTLWILPDFMNFLWLLNLCNEINPVLFNYGSEIRRFLVFLDNSAMFNFAKYTKQYNMTCLNMFLLFRIKVTNALHSIWFLKIDIVISNISTLTLILNITTRLSETKYKKVLFYYCLLNEEDSLGFPTYFCLLMLRKK